jgi:hypothetical protein
VQLHIDIENMLINVIVNQKVIMVVTKICGSKVGRKEIFINYVVIEVWEVFMSINTMVFDFNNSSINPC